MSDDTTPVDKTRDGTTGNDTTDNDTAAAGDRIAQVVSIAPTTQYEDRPTMVVTGGSRGIGAATAVGAARQGWNVVVNYASNDDAAADVVAQCERHGAIALAVRGDVTDELAVAALFDEAVEVFGVIDSVVNNAGILHQQSRFEDMTVERWRNVIDVNVLGAFIVARDAVLRMAPRHGGRGGTIINVSSAAARLGSANEYVDYAATKGAIDTMTVGLAGEVAADGIRVNSVRPGLIHTEIHASGGEPGRIDRLKGNVPMQRGGTAAEVADTILWLASEASSYVTGAMIDVSGGR